MSESKSNKGSYSAVASTHRCGWKLRHVYYEDGKRRIKVVPLGALKALGFSLELSLEEAKARAKQLNKEQRKDRDSAREAAIRGLKLEADNSRLLPDLFVDKFNLLIMEDGATDRNRPKLKAQWEAVKKLIKVLDVPPGQYVEHQARIYSHFVKERYSLSYAKKCITMLNKWGEFLSGQQGSFYRKVKMPVGLYQERINDSYEESDNFRGESDPLTPEMLKGAKQRLSEDAYNWLLLSVWFGLRPAEVDSLVDPDPKRWRIEHDDDKAVDVLVVYQAKLVTISKDKRWKYIPAFLPEQVAALPLVGKGFLRRPDVSEMRAAFGETTGIRPYGGRKGFMDLMLNLGQELVDISAWMGHQKVDRTWSTYRNKKRVSFTKPVKRRKSA